MLPTYETSNDYINPFSHLSFIIIHILFLLFIISFIRTAVSDPGFYNDNYVELYSMVNYYEAYKKYFENVINRKEKRDSILSTHEYPNLINSNKLLKKTNLDE